MPAIALVFNFCIACKRHVGEVLVNHVVISLAVLERLQKVAVAEFKFDFGGLFDIASNVLCSGGDNASLQIREAYALCSQKLNAGQHVNAGTCADGNE